MKEDHVIYKSDLQVIRCFKAPPNDVISVVTAALLLLGYPIDKRDWYRAVRFLNWSGKDSVLCRMKEFNKDTVTPEVAQKAREFLEGSSPEAIHKASAAAFGLFHWTKSKLDQIEPAGETRP